MPAPNRPVLRISPTDLDALLEALTVSFVALSECLVSEGHSLELGGTHAPGIHYNLAGNGRIIIGQNPPVEIQPHTLIIVPSNCPFRIEAPSVTDTVARIAVDGRRQTISKDGVRRFVAGEGKPDIILICGYFRAKFGTSTDLFGTLSSPIVERFDVVDQIDGKLKSALAELVSQEVGAGAMSSALLKQVIIALLRKSLTSTNLWIERFALLGDPRVARAFATMTADPGAPHSVQSLAEAALLSRSSFMARFTRIVGKSPMTLLRDLRMRQALYQLQTSDVTIDRIALEAGYKSKSSFLRTFRKSYGKDPSAFRRGVPPGSQG
jgi:AraC-like DNA-binding protein